MKLTAYITVTENCTVLLKKAWNRSKIRLESPRDLVSGQDIFLLISQMKEKGIDLRKHPLLLFWHMIRLKWETSIPCLLKVSKLAVRKRFIDYIKGFIITL